MKYKKSMIIIMLAIFLFSIAAVSASDLNDMAIVSGDDGQIELSQSGEVETDNLQTGEEQIVTQTDNDENLSASNELDVLSVDEVSFTTLEGEILSTGGNVELQHDYYTYQGVGSTISIYGDNRIIDGRGAVIDMAESTIQAFYVDGSGITIKNLTIKNANYEGYGGAIYFSKSGTVENCTFTNNKATGDDNYGGAIYFSSSGTVKNCNFVDNKATEDGGAIYFSSSGTVKNCNFTNNTAFQWGGAIRFARTGNVTNCNFTNNSARYGGAIEFAGTGNVTNCNFVNNSATKYDGGAVYFYYKGNVTKCNFTNNKATGVDSCGGAVYFDENSEGNVTNCSFTNNSATKNGGAIYFDEGSNGRTINCNFTGNNATTGSAIYFYYDWTTKTVSNSIFLNNRANVEALDVTKNDNNITITFTGQDNLLNAIYSDGDVSFTNVTYWSVNGIANTGSSPTTPARSNKEAGQNITLEIYDYDDSLVENITLVTNDNGQVTYNLIKLINCDYKYKAYHSQDCYYSYAETSGTFNIKLGDFNLLQRYINRTDANSVLTLDRNYTFTIGLDENLVDGIVIDKPITINGNGYTINALQKARIFKVTSNKVVLNNITFTNANASGDGGAVYFSSDGTVINCNFTNNQIIGEMSYGGAVYFSSNGTVINCNFTNNSVDFSGGAIWMVFGSVENCNFINNKVTSYDAGAVCFSNSGTVINCNFTNNSASRDGGAIWMDSGSVENCSFANNSASRGGGAIWMYSGSVENCSFANNSASHDGGAIRFYSGSVDNCNFTGNNATSGSAIYFFSLFSSYSRAVSNSCFLNNRANAEALEVTKNENNITLTFKGNDNLLNAIYSKSDVTVTNVTYLGANGINITGSSAITPSRSNKEAGQNITVGVVVDDVLVLNEVKLTDENGMIVLDIIAGENYYISVRHEADSYYTEAENATSNMTFNVNVASQTTKNKTVNITAKSNILNEVMPGKLLFIVPNSNLINATYAGNGTWWALHTFDGAGDYNVNASYIGLDNVTINNATISIRYDASVEVNNKTLDLLIGDTFTIVATTTPEGLNVSYVPDDSGVYSVDENGKVTALRDGKGSILIKVGGNGTYAENFTIVNVTVSKIPTEITVLNDTIVMAVGDEIATGATLTPPDAGNLTYSISNSSVVKLKDGKIIALAEGKTTITVSFEGDKKHLAAENKTINVTVRLDDTNVTADDLTLDVYANATISPITTPSGLEVEYASGNVSIAEVDVNGVVTGHNAGNTTITITTKADGIHAVNSTTINVFVNKINSTIDVNDTVFDYGETAKVNATFEGALGITAKLNGEEIIFSGDSVPIPVLNAGTYNLTVTTIPDENHNAVSKTVTVTVLKQSTTFDIEMQTNITAGEETTVNVKLQGDATGNVTVNVDGTIGDNATITNGAAKLTIPPLKAGPHTIEVCYSGDSNYNPGNKTAEINVNKKSTRLTAANVTTTYNIDRNLVINLTDEKGNPLIGVDVTVELSNAKNYKTDENGQIKVAVGKLTPNIYTAKISFKGNENYTSSSTTAKVKVKKATPRIIATAQTYKTTTKTKKFTIKLKDNTGKPIKYAKVYLKVKGVTYKATTNKYGKATFRITKLTKAGTHKAVITYKKNSYYYKVTKKVKLTVKPAWKTISKGSNAHTTVKKIQQALKNNGYYLTYAGHYLMIDGIYGDCTERSVKEFQTANGLKVTGKVDEATAKKLKLI